MATITLDQDGIATAASQASIEALTQIGIKLRIHGSELLAMPHSSSVSVIEVGDGTEGGIKVGCRFTRGETGTQLTLRANCVAGPESTLFERDLISADQWYRLYVGYNPGAGGWTTLNAQLFSEAGASIAACPGNFTAPLPTGPGTGRIRIGQLLAFVNRPGMALQIDGVAIYNTHNASVGSAGRWSTPDPDTETATLRSAVGFVEGSGSSAVNAVAGGNTFALSGHTWSPGGSWNFGVPPDPMPETPTLAVTPTSWDAVRLQVTLGAETDEINVYRSLTSPADAGDTLVATLAASGEHWDVDLDPETPYYYVAIASNEAGDTPSAQRSATTWSDDAVSTFEDNDPITFPISVPDGMRARTVNLSLGKIIREAEGLGRAVGFSVLVEDGDDEVVGSGSFPDVPAVNEGTPQVVTLSPYPIGPQTLTVTITPTIEA